MRSWFPDLESITFTSTPRRDQILVVMAIGNRHLLTCRQESIEWYKGFGNLRRISFPPPDDFEWDQLMHDLFSTTEEARLTTEVIERKHTSFLKALLSKIEDLLVTGGLPKLECVQIGWVVSNSCRIFRSSAQGGFVEDTGAAS